MADTMASAGSEIKAFRTGPVDGALGAVPLKRALLISNRIVHYRVSVYNYFCRRFREHGWDFVVITNKLQQQNQNRCQFELVERPFNFFSYRAGIRRINPDVVILFLRLKDYIL